MKDRSVFNMLAAASRIVTGAAGRLGWGHMLVNQCEFGVTCAHEQPDGNSSYLATCRISTELGMTVPVTAMFVEGPDRHELVVADLAEKILDTMMRLKESDGAHDAARQRLERSVSRHCATLRRQGIDISLVEVAPRAICLHDQEWNNVLLFDVVLRMLSDELRPAVFNIGADDPRELRDHMESSVVPELRALHAKLLAPVELAALPKAA